MRGTCALCHAENVELQDSHLMPKWSYKRAGQATSGLVNVEGGRAYQSSRQTKQYLLCKPCENRFGIREDCVSRLCWQTDGSLPILALLKRQPEDADDPVEVVQIEAQNTESLAYFASSVIWRADAMKKGVQLGEHGEPLRQYLNDEAPFPATVRVTLTVFKAGTVVTSMDRVLSFPSTDRVEFCDRHTFVVCGLHFDLYANGLLPEVSHYLCLVHATPKRVAVMFPEASGVAGGIFQFGGGARPSKKLAAWRKSRR
jgi:hypothetical protein